MSGKARGGRTAQQSALEIAVYMQDFGGGGVERLFVRLAAHWIQFGHRVTFLVNAVEGPLHCELPRAAEVRVVQGGKPMRSIPAIVGYVRKCRPDIVLSGHDHANIALMLAQRLTGGVPTRFVASQHGFLTRPDRRTWKTFVSLQLYRLLLGSADRVVAVSASVALEMQRLVGLRPDQVNVIHNGAVPDDVTELIKERAAERFMSELSDKPTIIGVGRLVADKDFATLLRAVAILRSNQRLDCNVLILGEGPERGHLQALAHELGLSRRFFLPGYRANPFAYMARASILAMPSRSEGFGNVVAEALACGTPVVVASGSGGPEEILAGGGYGHVVPAGDPKAMADAIHATLTDRLDRNALRARGMEFGEAACAMAYLNLFLSVSAAGTAEVLE